MCFEVLCLIQEYHEANSVDIFSLLSHYSTIFMTNCMVIDFSPCYEHGRRTMNKFCA